MHLLKKELDEVSDFFSLVVEGPSVKDTAYVTFQDGKAWTFTDWAVGVVPDDFGLDCVVPLVPFQALLRSLVDPRLDVSLEEGHLRVVGSKGKGRLMALSKGMFRVSFDDLGLPSNWQAADISKWAGAVCEVMSCCSRDEVLPSLMFVHVTPDYVEACDRFQAMRIHVENPVGGEFLLVALPSIGRCEGVKEVASSGNWLCMKDDRGWVRGYRVVRDDYPDISGVLSLEGVKLPCTPWMKGAVGRLASFARLALQKRLSDPRTSTDNMGIDSSLVSAAKNVFVDVVVGSGSMKMSVDTWVGHMEEEGEFPYDGETVRFKVAPTLLARVVDKELDLRVGKDKLTVSEGDKIYSVVTEA